MRGNEQQAIKGVNQAAFSAYGLNLIFLIKLRQSYENRRLYRSQFMRVFVWEILV